ncbi:MAG: hemerythrin domain-containing protein [Bacteroidales bacterium]|jgi:regulator of cell morphogenesis and NO signaling|nr:hemerythrin domain-containing protein [Bacteroidales bacterium]
MTPTLFTAKMKMADLILANHNLVLILPRFGIDLGFGEKSIEEVCAAHQVSLPFFLIVCNIYAYDDYFLTPEQITFNNLQGMLPYLAASHHHYLRERIPHIEHHLQKIAESCTPKQGAILMRFFTEYKDEVAKHFNYEEEVVFPYIEGLWAGKDTDNYVIHQYKETHSNVEEKLEDLTNIIIKYLPSNVLPNEKASVLFDIFRLATDLNKHELIEEKVLIPYVVSIEKHGV